MKILGIGLLVFGALGFIGCISDPEIANGAILAVVFMIAGIQLIRKSNKLKKDIQNVKQYRAIILDGNVRQLGAIASTTGKTYETVHKELEQLIKKGYLKNAYIDEAVKEVVIPNSGDIWQNTKKSVPVQTRTVHCSCCGANSTIKGDIGECEYCGSPVR